MKSRAWSKHRTSSGVTTYSRRVLAGSITPSERRRTKSPFWTCSGMSISSRNSVMGNTFPRSIGPVFDLQPGNQVEVLQVAGHQCRLVGKRDGSDEQIGPADLLELLVGPQTVELGRCFVGDRHDAESSQIAFRLIETLLSTLQLGSVGCLQHR